MEGLGCRSVGLEVEPPAASPVRLSGKQRASAATNRLEPPFGARLDLRYAMARLFNYFLRGLVVVVPLALTIYVCLVIFTTIDSWLGLPVRGAGFVVALL